MTQARQQSEWGHTSSILALLANCHRDSKKRPAPFAPEEFNPCKRANREKPVANVPIGVLKDIFLGH